MASPPPTSLNKVIRCMIQKGPVRVPLGGWYGCLEGGGPCSQGPECSKLLGVIFSASRKNPARTDVNPMESKEERGEKEKGKEATREKMGRRKRGRDTRDREREREAGGNWEREKENKGVGKAGGKEGRSHQWLNFLIWTSGSSYV